MERRGEKERTRGKKVETRVGEKITRETPRKKVGIQAPRKDKGAGKVNPDAACNLSKSFSLLFPRETRHIRDDFESSSGAG